MSFANVLPPTSCQCESEDFWRPRKMKPFEEPMTPRLKTQKPKTTKNWTAGN